MDRVLFEMREWCGVDYQGMTGVLRVVSCASHAKYYVAIPLCSFWHERNNTAIAKLDNQLLKARVQVK